MENILMKQKTSNFEIQLFAMFKYMISFKVFIFLTPLWRVHINIRSIQKLSTFGEISTGLGTVSETSSGGRSHFLNPPPPYSTPMAIKKQDNEHYKNMIFPKNSYHYCFIKQSQNTIKILQS